MNRFIKIILSLTFLSGLTSAQTNKPATPSAKPPSTVSANKKVQFRWPRLLTVCRKEIRALCHEEMLYQGKLECLKEKRLFVGLLCDEEIYLVERYLHLNALTFFLTYQNELKPICKGLTKETLTANSLRDCMDSGGFEKLPDKPRDAYIRLRR